MSGYGSTSPCSFRCPMVAADFSPCQLVRGTRLLLSADAPRISKVFMVRRTICLLFSFRPIIPPSINSLNDGVFLNKHLWKRNSLDPPTLGIKAGMILSFGPASGRDLKHHDSGILSIAHRHDCRLRDVGQLPWNDMHYSPRSGHVCPVPLSLSVLLHVLSVLLLPLRFGCKLSNTKELPHTTQTQTLIRFSEM